MIQIKVTDREGKLHLLEGPIDMGLNIMELCKAYELPVEGTCGGMAMCASCQCYVQSAHELPEMRGAEEEMLDQAFFVADNSRLGCQLSLTKSMNGLELELAPES